MFCVYTDHKPLEKVFESKVADRSPRQTNHLSLISEFTTDIRYVKGEENVVADCLSRWEMASINELSAERLAKLQKEDMKLKQLIEGASLKHNSLKFDKIDSLIDSTSLMYELSSAKPVVIYHHQSVESCSRKYTNWHIRASEQH